MRPQSGPASSIWGMVRDAGPAPVRAEGVPVAPPSNGFEDPRQADRHKDYLHVSAQLAYT